MGDLGNVMGKAGLKVSSPPRGAERSGGPPRSSDRGGSPFPPGYPQYFTESGFLRVELVLAEAERVADRFYDDGLKRHQLRAFFDSAKMQLQRLRYGAAFEGIVPEVARLKAAAADRSMRANPIPPSFKEFIDRNIDAVTDKKSFEKGFMPHFEAVVAYCAKLRDN